MKKLKNKQSIYLAGGFRSGWQNRVIITLSEWEIFDPSSHNLSAPRDYLEWDIKSIESCDIVLAYLESTNPGGYALAFEVGYGKALGKIVYLVEEHPTSERNKYFEMIRYAADECFETLDQALDSLKNLVPADK